MRSLLFLCLLAIVETSHSQVVVGWGQCGGSGFSGPTICSSGFVCNTFNPYYSQCIPAAASVVPSTSTTAKSTTLTTKASTSTTSSKSVSSSKTSISSSTKSFSTSAATTATGSCTAVFTPVSASAAFAALNPGWNLGNTLDATPDEGSWNNPPVQATTFSQIQAYGFKSVRVPVTWAYHFVSGSPSWTVNATWMNRVETVIDQALATGMYVVLNVHHDSWTWADVSAAGANITAIEEQFSSLWAQIGTRFACKSSKLIFEPINEPVGTTQEHATELNKLNDIFLTQINKAGGNNAKRVVSLSGLGQDSIKTSQWFERGSLFPNQPWGLQFHYYSPYDFIFSAWGKTIWGSDADKASLLTDFQLFNGNFSGIPTFIGEWDASPTNTETAARWKYFDYFTRTARSFKYSTIIWDNGLDLFNRATNTWTDSVAIDILMKGTAGITNSLADSTIDPASTSQTSSAYIFHKLNDPITAQSVTYLLNGNSLLAIKDSSGKVLTSSQYTISGGVVTFTTTYLSGFFSSSSLPGIKETLTVTFSAGAALKVQIVQYDTPVIPTTSYKVQATDLSIPITYKGVPKVAAVRALKADGTYLADDWTVYLGPLQNARWTLGSWKSEDTSNLVIAASGLAAIQATGQTVTLLVEFFPRSVGANAVNVTITQ